MHCPFSLCLSEKSFFSHWDFSCTEVLMAFTWAIPPLYKEYQPMNNRPPYKEYTPIKHTPPYEEYLRSTDLFVLVCVWIGESICFPACILALATEVWHDATLFERIALPSEPSYCWENLCLNRLGMRLRSMRQ